MSCCIQYHSPHTTFKMSATDLSAEQNNLIKKIAEDEDIFDYSIEVKSGSMKGDNYLGIITAVTVNGNDGRKIDLVLKSSHQSEMFRKQAPIRRAYLREIDVYEIVFPELNKFAEERGVPDAFTAHAKCYASSSLENHEMLALENLREIGYDLWSRRVAMNPEHIALVFREYGKFHALSLAMKHEEPERFDNLKSKLGNIFEGNTPEEAVLAMFRSQIEKLVKVLENNQKAVDALQKYLDEEGYKFMLDKTEHQYAVIAHGDCWNNNMMFKYDDPTNPSTPTKVCLLDWQIVKISSPIQDLSYFFYVCSPKESLDNYQHFLRIYHESVAEMLQKLGCNPEEVFPFSALEQEWKTHSKFGLHMAVMVIKLMLAEVDEAPNMEEIAESGKNLMESLDVETVNDEEYNKRLEELVVFMAEHDFI